MNKLSILVIAACPFPANYGSPAAIRELSDSMAEIGHDVHIVTYSYGDDLPVKYAKVHRLPKWGASGKVTVGPTWQKPIYDFMLIFLACHIAFKYKCRIIHAHNYEGALVGICARVITGLPLLYNAVNLMSDELHTYNFIKPQWLAKKLAGFLDWFVPLIPDEILTISNELKVKLIDAGVPPAKITVIPIGVLPELFDHADPKRFSPTLNPKGAPMVIYAGTIDFFQRVDYLVEAFARLDAAHADALLFFVCPFTQPELKKDLQEQARKLNIEHRLVWVDSHPLEDLPDYLILGSVAVVPRPNCPGYPVKLLNYMCASRPIVVAEGSAKGLLHLENGYVCADDDVDGMSKGIALLLTDRKLAERLGKAAHQTLLEEFDWRALCRKIEPIYQKMLLKKEGETS
jgi:1,2-diacylglycerol 3-alpha-glucosyltransferase